ncbi:MAG TPA: NlpC/P60 family protein [Abditibacteriaceae bacterium]|nr:NlpC/P60 family protein [Abditibacteriaceae bacterium]
MKLKHWLVGATLTGLTVSGGTPALRPQAAHADVYHAVEAGETLSSIAARYQTRADVLRAANVLRDIADDTALPAMLLRIPDGEATNGRSTQASITLVSQTPQTNGTIATSQQYAVQPGDTIESIALRYTQAGYPVTAEAIRRKNNLIAEPAPGAKILVPLQTAVYNAASQVAPRTDGSRFSAPGAEVSEAMELPFARVIPQQKPVYQSSNPAHKKRPAKRGPSVLGSRGYSPSSDPDGVRSVDQGEDASSATTPQPRLINPPLTPKSVALAKVARVATSGARIRRLPQSTAVTLYNCAVGTELVVMGRSGPWSSILMSDRSTGWVPTRYLKLTGGEVDISAQLAARSAALLNPNYNRFTGDANGNYSSSNPAVAYALGWLGTPYRYGGQSRNGIDCSSLVQKSFDACGLRLPRTAAQQATVGQAVDPAALQAGDRLYFSASGSRIDHTGLYIGDGKFVHASGRGRGVIVSNLTDPQQWNIFVGARR